MRTAKWGWWRLTKFFHIVATGLPGFRRSKQPGWKARSRQADLPIKAIRGLAITTLALVVAALLFLILSLSGTAYSVNDLLVHPDIGVDDTGFGGSRHTTSQNNILSGTMANYGYGEIPAVNYALSGHSDIPFTESNGVEVPSSIQRVVLSDTVGLTTPPDSFIGHISNLVKTRLSWYVLIVTPNTLLFVLIIKRIVKETWSTPQIQVHID